MVPQADDPAAPEDDDLLRELLEIDELLLATLIRHRLTEPTVPWALALARLGLSETELESVDLSDYSVSLEE